MTISSIIIPKWISWDSDTVYPRSILLICGSRLRKTSFNGNQADLPFLINSLRGRIFITPMDSTDAALLSKTVVTVFHYGMIAN